ncbi:MAG: hypothetical protein ACFFF4_18950, partial [Candidatus Thorarchaeota archaeon]
MREIKIAYPHSNISIWIFGLLGLFLFCLFLSTLKYLGFTGVVPNQSTIVQILQVLGTLVIVMGITSFILISYSLRKLTQGYKGFSYHIVVGFVIGLCAVVVQTTALLLGQNTAEELMTTPYAVYWMYWPLYSFVPMIGMTAFAGLLIISILLVILFQSRIITISDFVQPLRGISLIAFPIIGILIPLIGLHGYLDGNFLFGRVSTISPAAERFTLFERTSAYGLPSLVYFDGIDNGNIAYAILGCVGLIYIVMTGCAFTITLMGWAKRRKVNKENIKSSRYFQIARSTAIVSITLLWGTYTTLYLFNQWAMTYDIFLDTKGIYFGFLSMICVYHSTTNMSSQGKENGTSIILQKPWNFKKSFREPILVSLFVLLFLTTSLAVKGLNGSYLSIQPTIEVEEDIQSCLEKYEEKFVQSILDPTYGFVPTDGYPMYLFVLGEMYYWMYMMSGESQYEERLLNLAEVSLSIRNMDWTWNMGWRNRISNLYNSLAAQLFLYCFYVTHNQIYLSYANYSLQSLLQEGVVNFSGTNDDKFLAFSIIATYLEELEGTDSGLQNFGYKLYNFSIS